MNATVANPEVRAYLEAVRAHLVGVPEPDMEELLDDLESHLLEVAAEDDGPLEDRLGPPVAYAEELRVTAGLPQGEAPPRDRLSRRMRTRFERSAPGRMLDVAWSSKTAGALRSFLPELRPGWWVLRGYLLAGLAIMAYEGPTDNPLIPFAMGSGYVIGAIAIVGAILASVALGRATQHENGPRRLALLVNLGVLIVAGVGASQLGSKYSDEYYYEPTSDYQALPYLNHAGGHAIANICPYGLDGKLLSGVLLFDQDGRPIDDTILLSMDGNMLAPKSPQIGNAYPRDFTGIERFDDAQQNYATGTQTPLVCPSSVASAPTSPGTAGVPTPIPGSSD